MNTGEYLKSYINDTKRIATNALKRIDNSAYFNIYPSLDIGIPYDVDRLAGGFPNGIYVKWKCDTPIIPVDATVNVCTVSIFKIEEEDNISIFLANLNDMMECKKSTYSLNFDRGNHFIVLCEDIHHKKYLLLHSTAKEFTKSYNGLYPTYGNWYYDKIKVYEENNRYFRYIMGREAELFRRVALSLNKYNEIRHEHFAYLLLKNYAGIKNTNHYHHYFMPNENSICIGTYLMKKNDIFPILSSPGTSIDLYRVDSSSVEVEKGLYLCPHGWGKESNIDLNIEINLQKKILKINKEEYSIFKGESLFENEDFVYRKYLNDEGEIVFYEKHGEELKGKIFKRLYQIVSYTKNGLDIFK